MERQSLILTVTLIGDFSVVMPRQGSVGTSISDISNHIIIPTIYRGCHQLYRLAGTLSILLLTRKGYLVSPLHITLQYNNIPKVPVTTMQGSGQRQGWLYCTVLYCTILCLNVPSCVRRFKCDIRKNI